MRFLVGVVIEVALHQDEGGALVAGAGGQVAQGADQIGQTAGGSALGGHGACQIALFSDLLADGFLQRFAGKVGNA